MNDASIIKLFFERNEQAISEISNKYGKICYRLANNILNRLEDAEECVNDTYFKLWTSIPPDKPEHLLAYTCKITKHLALSKIRHNTAIKRSDNLSISFDELSDMISGMENPEEVYDAKEMSKSISEFLSTQKQIERQIFVRRYWYLDSIETIAEQFKINPHSVATILFRMRKKLKKYLIKGGYEL